MSSLRGKKNEIGTFGGGVGGGGGRVRVQDYFFRTPVLRLFYWAGGGVREGRGVHRGFYGTRLVYTIGWAFFHASGQCEYPPIRHDSNYTKCHATGNNYYCM